MDPVVSVLLRGRELVEQGDDEGARALLLDALVQAPNDLRVLTDLGTLLFRTGYRSAARTVYAQAVQFHPSDAVAHSNLAGAHFDAGDLLAARSEYEIAIAIDSKLQEAHQGLSYVFNRIGDEAGARVHRELGFRDRPIVVRPYRGPGNGTRVLCLVSAGGGNIFTDHLLDDLRFETTTLVVDFIDPHLALPPHDVVFNTIGDADRASGALLAAVPIVERSRARVINHPAVVLATSRVQNAGRFSLLPGVLTPKTIVVQRASLASEARAFGYPLLLRSLGFHTGEFFMKVDRERDLESAAAALPGDALLVMEYIDSRSPDGSFRKYRVMIVGGTLYPLHAAVSRDWKVHYFTADMHDNAEHRREDQAFLEDIESVIGADGMQSLEQIRSAVGLEYAGIDFARMPDGRIVVFEANATMIVLPPDADSRWNYRRGPVSRVLEAVESLLRANGAPCCG